MIKSTGHDLGCLVGAFGYLTKPVEIDPLSMKIRQAEARFLVWRSGDI